MPLKPTLPDNAKLDRIVADARREREQREKTYRDQALKIFPWICGRCAREFTRENLHQQTVHHKDDNHHNNPPDGSNWELLCVYCHENEHRRYLDDAARREATSESGEQESQATYKPFADLKSLLKGK